MAAAYPSSPASGKRFVSPACGEVDPDPCPPCHPTVAPSARNVRSGSPQVFPSPNRTKEPIMTRLPLVAFGALALLLGGCKPASDSTATTQAPAASASAPAEPETLAADTPRTTVDGNPFVAPAGWTLETRGPAVLLTPPEGGSRIALVDVAGDEADAAVAAAWQAYDADAKWPLKLATDRPARDGW